MLRSFSHPPDERSFTLPPKPPVTSRRSLLAVILVPLMLVLQTLWFTISGAQAATLEEIKQRGGLFVATENDVRPGSAAK